MSPLQREFKEFETEVGNKVADQSLKTPLSKSQLSGIIGGVAQKEPTAGTCINCELACVDILCPNWKSMYVNVEDSLHALNEFELNMMDLPLQALIQAIRGIINMTTNTYDHIRLLLYACGLVHLYNKETNMKVQISNSITAAVNRISRPDGQHFELNANKLAQWAVTCFGNLHNGSHCEQEGTHNTQV